MSGPKQNLTRDQFIRLIDGCKSFSEAARKMGLSRQRISQLAFRHGVTASIKRSIEVSEPACK